MTALNPWLDFGLANVLVPGSNKGKIVYVDTDANGASDSNSGLRVGEAKVSIHGALAICNDYMWDTIVVLNHENAQVVEWPIKINKAGVRIIGAPGGGWHPRYTGGQIIQPDENAAGMTLDANHIRIEGFEFRAGASHAGIEFVTTGVGRHGIYRCVFHSGAHGVWLTAGNAPEGAGPTIKDCFFMDGLTADGVRYNSNAAFARIEDNIFDSVGGIAINIMANQATCLMILRNIIGLLTNAAAKGIVISGAECWRSIINLNYANFSEADMEGSGTNNPYLDSSAPSGGAPQCNHWLLNYRNIAAILPA